MSESGDKPQTTTESLRAEPSIVVKEKDYNDLKADLAESQQALREIKKLIDAGGDPGRCLDDIYGIVIDTIARNARKGGE